MTVASEVVVEAALGPEKGYYHSPENGTWLGSETVSREEAEADGYSPCSSCFPGSTEEVTASAE